MTNIIDITDLKQSHNDNETYEISFTRVQDIDIANEHSIWYDYYLESTDHGHTQYIYSEDYNSESTLLMRMDGFLAEHYYYEEKL
tara:strand:- start:2281 stop:2535 length:255 start_codon:yes stop_codon:yes gene_type:complete